MNDQHITNDKTLPILEGTWTCEGLREFPGVTSLITQLLKIFLQRTK